MQRIGARPTSALNYRIGVVDRLSRLGAAAFASDAPAIKGELK